MPEYVELHCHSAFSLREGASTPDELVLRARALGYQALALTDHDGLYGAMEFAGAARAWDVRPITGAELTLADGHHLTLLAATRRGYGNLCRLITAARMGDAGPHPPSPPPSIGGGGVPAGSHREHPRLDPALLPGHAEGLIALSGCRRGEAAAHAAADDLAAAETALRKYRDWFGPQHFYVELQQNLVSGDTPRNAALAALARDLGLQVVATNNVHYHVRARHRLQDVLVAIRHRTTLDGSHRERRPNSEFYLKSKEEMAVLFRDCPAAIENTLRIAERCTFNLATDLDYAFPDYDTPTGETPDAYLAHLCREELARRYSPLAPDLLRRAEERLAEELRLITRHRLAGFFLHYRDLLLLARGVADEVYGRDPSRPRDWQPAGRGRGSSVGSIVCYLIGLSHIDPIKTGLFLGRFLNEELSSVPDIDLDFPRKVREELLRRMMAPTPRPPPPMLGEGENTVRRSCSPPPGSALTRSGRGLGVGAYNEHAALVCTFPTYQIRSAVRDVGKALGLPEAELDKLAKASGWTGADQLAEEMARMPDFRGRIHAPLWRDLIALAREIDGLPRHVSQHVGGIIISSRPLVELVPLEPAAMEGRYLCGWDKDSVDDARFIKIDFLALGMLSLVDECLELIREQRGQFPDLGRIPHDDPRVFDMICKGDTLGVFQIESRAQIQTLPRTRPRSIEDLIVEVAIIRPGPITGGAVNPYILRRQGREPVTYDHPALEPVLKDTLGVILFQEQVLQVAMVIAGFTAGQAETLRRAMSRKRSREAMGELWEPFRRGALANGVGEATAQAIFQKLLGFAAFGFPKSHSAAFALLAYESAWLKLHYPVEFYCALLNNQPMGFYSPAVLVGDARRHGVRVLRPDVNTSGAKCTVEDAGAGSREPEAGDGSLAAPAPGSRLPAPDDAVRIGFAYVDGISEATATMIAAERERGGPYRSLFDFVQRTGLRREPSEHLIAVGAFDGFGLGRRELLWQLGLFGRMKDEGRRMKKGSGSILHPSSFILPAEQDMVSLPEPTAWERMVADYGILRLSPDHHPLALLRPRLGEGYLTSAMLERLRDGMAVTVAGLVVCRQRPMTASGFTFLSLEDEHGLANVIVRPTLYERKRTLIRTEPFLLVSGVLQRRDGTTNVLARDVHPLRVPPDMVAPRSKDWG